MQHPRVQGVQRWPVHLRMLRSHFWTLFLLQPPVEGGLGSANVSLRGGPLEGLPWGLTAPPGGSEPWEAVEGTQGAGGSPMQGTGQTLAEAERNFWF